MIDNDRSHLLRAIGLARTHMEAGVGGSFGAVIVCEGKLLAEGWNMVTSSNDPSAHAEVVAIRRACQTLGTARLDGATLYASCEPCPMCLGAIYWAHVDRLVFAGTKVDAAGIGFDDDFIYQEFARPTAQRRLATQHMPLVEHDAVFADWVKKTDRKPY